MELDKNKIPGSPKPKSSAAPKTEGFTIIGVGASAGGLEALYALFAQPVPFNLSFVVIQHLSPDFKSITADLLASHSHRKVIPIENDMQVEANNIYVLTERKKLEIKGGKLILNPLDPISRNNSLDIFCYRLCK